MGDLYWGVGGHEVDNELTQRDNALIAGGVNMPAEQAMQYWGVMDPMQEKILAENMKAHALANPRFSDAQITAVLSRKFLPRSTPDNL